MPYIRIRDTLTCRQLLSCTRLEATDMAAPESTKDGRTSTG
jgi:hypothetical protein